MTRNLLRDDLTLATLEDILSRHPRRPLLPPLGAKEWERVMRNPVAIRLLQPLRAKAETECDEPLPELTDDLYAGYGITGIRIDFEKVYFERRRMLARAVISLLLSRGDDPWRERLTESMLAKFTAVFEEVSWSLPAHVEWKKGNITGKDPLQIDLFCAETANLMAEMLDLFEAIIPTELQLRVRERLQRTIFGNYLNGHFRWFDMTNNWNAVCHQGVLGAALSQLDDTRLLAKMLMKTWRYLPGFLQGFGADGGCDEGPGYWNYGFGWFATLNEQLESRTDGELSLFEGDKKVREMALFGPRVSLTGDNLVNFADGGATGGLRPSLVAYLGSRLNEPDCTLSALDNYSQLATSSVGVDSQRCDVFYLARLFLFCPEDLSLAGHSEKKDCFLPDLAVLVAHGTDRTGHRWDFAAKGGHNEENHNHNDCGSYILNIDGVRLITEIGAPEYVRDFFVSAETRYKFLAARTLGHSLPIINGCEQVFGRIHASRVVSHSLETDHTEFVVDATACYPAEAACKSFVRAFRFEKGEGKLTIEDTFNLAHAGALETAVITFQSLSIVGDHALTQAGELKLLLCPMSGTRLDRVETHAYRDHNGKDARIHRLVLKPDTLALQITLGIEMTLG